jgi:hypothetical protein
MGIDVTLCERDKIGTGISNAAGGMLASTAEVNFEEVRLLQLAQASLAFVN